MKYTSSGYAILKSHNYSWNQYTLFFFFCPRLNWNRRLNFGFGSFSLYYTASCSGTPASRGFTFIGYARFIVFFNWKISVKMKCGVYFFTDSPNSSSGLSSFSASSSSSSTHQVSSSTSISMSPFIIPFPDFYQNFSSNHLTNRYLFNFSM